MSLLTKQIEEINTHLLAYLWNKAVKVMIKDEPHYISSVRNNEILFFDWNKMEGCLQVMRFMDESPDGRINFDDMTAIEISKFIQDVMDPSKVVDIVILITEVDTDDDDVPENIIIDESTLIGHVVEKQLVYQQEYIAIIEYSQEDAVWRVVSYHPKIIQERENAQVWSIINTITLSLEIIRSSQNPLIILDKAEYPFEPVQINMLGVIYDFIDADIFRDEPIIKLENTEKKSIMYYPTTKEWLEEYQNSLLAYITVRRSMFNLNIKEKWQQ